jgi:hypothetical protein
MNIGPIEEIPSGPEPLPVALGILRITEDGPVRETETGDNRVTETN